MTKQSRRPVLLLELNEVPWRVIDYARSHGRRHIDRFFGTARTYTTISRDSGELSPWITWPSLHRGMSSDQHGIRALGQDVGSFRGVPIWEEFRQSGESIGVFGSLQSWPPIDPGNGGFFVPDTFAHDERCVPAYLEPLQRFNLQQVRNNGRVIERNLPRLKDVLAVLPVALRTRLPPGFYLEVARQLVGERRDPVRCGRRATFQTLLFWEVFRHLYDPRQPPAFTTFFTNHVASAMHRYWDALFPEDFGGAKKERPHLPTIEFAIDVADRMLGDVLAMRDANPDLVIVVASSMGQAAVKRSHHGLELIVKDLDKLLGTFAVDKAAYRPLLAMVPQVAIAIDDHATRETLLANMSACVDSSGNGLFRVEALGASLSITTQTPSTRAAVEAGGFRNGNGKHVPWEAAGIRVVETEAGTAYHVPEGILAVLDDGRANDARARMWATDAKELLLELAGHRRRAAGNAH
jgi:hypothetical protein